MVWLIQLEDWEEYDPTCFMNEISAACSYCTCVQLGGITWMFWFYREPNVINLVMCGDGDDHFYQLTLCGIKELPDNPQTLCDSDRCLPVDGDKNFTSWGKLHPCEHKK